MCEGKNLAIIGASYLQLPLIIKAKEMGFVTHVFAWASNDIGESVADFFYPISIKEVEAITEKCREIGICGICSIATDLGNYTVNYVANKLGLFCNSMECTLKSTNKYLMRQAFMENGDPSPRSIIIDDNTDLKGLHFTFPLIVKPTDRSGSRGVNRVDSLEQLLEAKGDALNESFEKKAILEEYVDGKEYSVESISFCGRHTILAVTEKFTTGSPHFIETGHMEPADIDEDLFDEISKVIVHALESLKIRNGAAHSEIKINDDREIKIIEIGSRMGGDCIGSDLVWYSTGIDFLKAVIQVACGIEPNLEPTGIRRKVEVKFILSEADYKEFERIKIEEPESLLRIVDDRHFELIGKATNSANRAGCYIVELPE